MGLLISGQVFGVMLSSPLAGHLADERQIRSQLAFAGSAGRMLSYLAIYAAIIAESYWFMLLGTFSLGFSAGFFWTPLRAIISDATNYRFRSEAFGIFNQQVGIGTFYGAFIGFSIFIFANESNQGSEVLYAGLIVYAIANLYAGQRILSLGPRVPLIDTDASIRSPLLTQEKEKKGSKALRTSVAIYFSILLAILFLEHLIGSLVAPFLEIFLLENITDNPADVALAYAPGGFVSMLLAPTLGKWADKVKPQYWLSMTSLIGAITTWLLIQSTEIWQFTLLFVVDATVVSSAGLVLSKILSGLSRQRRGSVFGLEGFMSNLGSISGPLAGGILWDVSGDRAPFFLSILLEALLSIVYVVVFWCFLSDQEDRKEKDHRSNPRS